MNIDYTKLSKRISRALRHAPQEYGLKLDDNGWVSVDNLMVSLKKKWPRLEIDDLEKMMAASEKQRFEVVDGRIRAVYGHSIDKNIVMTPHQPPEYLYHGTARRFLDNIRTSGLRSMNRQYVHLSADTETAKIVGRRRDDIPHILRISAGQAFADGIQFYHANDTTWLTDNVEIKYIEFEY